MRKPFRWIRLDRIKGDPKKLDDYRTECHEVLCDLRENGQKIPILVRPIPRTGWLWFLKPQYFELIDGYQRVIAAMQLQWKSIIAQVMNITDAQLAEVRIIASEKRVPTDPSQYRKALIQVMKLNPDLTRQQLADKLGWTLERLERVLNDNNIRDLQ